MQRFLRNGTRTVLSAVALFLGLALTGSVRAGEPPQATLTLQKRVDVGAHDQEKTDLPGPASWSIASLKAEPLKIVKTAYDKEKMQVTWLLELTRDRYILEKLAPISFVFKDADGVTLGTVGARHKGILVSKKGERFRMTLDIPGDIWDQTRTVEATNEK